MRKPASLALTFVILVGVASLSGADDWPQYYGPTRDGLSVERGLARVWPVEGPRQLWRVPLGEGFAGPAVQGGEVFILDRDASKTDILLCLGLDDGKERWRFAYDAPGKSDYNGSRTTPAVDDKYVFTIGPMGDMYCISRATHKQVWRKHLLKDFGAAKPRYAVSQSPLLHEDTIIVAPLSPRVGVVALDKATGEVRWQSPAIGVQGCASPYVTTVAGVKQVVILSEDRIDAVELGTGKPLWTFRGFQCRRAIPAAVPLGEGRFFFTGGYGMGSYLLQVTKGADGFAVQQNRNFKECGSRVHTPLLYKGHLYVNSHDSGGGLMCLDLNGKILWRTGREPSFDLGGMLIADGLIYILDGATGLLRLAEATPDGYKELAKAQVLAGKQVWAPMALSDGRLLVRDQTQLRCLDVRAEGDRAGVTGARIVETPQTLPVTLYVNPAAAGASDRNDGSADHPLKTIAAAANQALSNQADGKGTRIIIAPGMYRESVSLRDTRKLAEVRADPRPATAPIVLEAAEKGKAILRGSEVWTGWEETAVPSAATTQPDSATTAPSATPIVAYTHAWPRPWAPAGNIWKGYGIEVGPLALRKEIVFVNDQCLRQTLDLQQLKEGMFCVAEDQKKIYIVPSAGVDMSKAVVEVGSRGRLFSADKIDHLVLRGLTFDRAATGMDEGAVELFYCNDVLIEDCRFEWNGWNGIRIGWSGVRDFTFRRTVMNHNGGNGATGNQIKNALFEDCEFSFNNWRGNSAGFNNWSSAGMKLANLHDGLLRRCKVTGNESHGLWFDWDTQRVSLVDCTLEANQRAGVDFEASKGPVRLSQCTIRRNGEMGVMIHSTSNGTLEDCTIVGNAAQIGVFIDTRTVGDWERPEAGTWKCQSNHWTITGCTIASENDPKWQAAAIAATSGWIGLKDSPRGSTQPLLHPFWPQYWKDFAQTLTSDGNTWHHPTEDKPFLDPDGVTPLSLDQWRQQIGQDRNSTLPPPRQTQATTRPAEQAAL